MQPRWPDEGAAKDLEVCRDLLRRGSKSFAAAALLLPRRARDGATALYAFCRVADDAIDNASDRAGEGVGGALAELRARIDRAYRGTPREDAVDRAFARAAAEHGIPRELMEALLEGFAWDAEGRRYESLEELRAYCARVAGTVGAMMTVIMGGRGEGTLARACDMGVAMQLTNIARDVGEDARAGRVYLPAAWLEEAGVNPAALVARPAHSEALGAVVERLLGHADELYARADAGIATLPRDCRSAICAARLIYSEIGRVVAKSGYDSVSRRAVVPLSTKLRLLVKALAWAGASGRVEELGDTPARRELNAPPLEETRFLVDAAAGGAAREAGAARLVGGVTA